MNILGTCVGHRPALHLWFAEKPTPKSWIWLWSAVVAVALAVPATQAQTVLKAGHINPKDGPEGVATDRFAELVKQKTGGQIVVEVFPAE